MNNLKKYNFKNNGFIALVASFFMTIFLSSCYEPSPLYGTWADNNGNKISFVSDGTFVAKIMNSQNQSVTYTGDYTVIDNVLVFSYTSDSEEENSSYSMNTEWDIRGSMLYLEWSIGGEEKTLVLYHTSK